MVFQGVHKFVHLFVYFFQICCYTLGTINFQGKKMNYNTQINEQEVYYTRYYNSLKTYRKINCDTKKVIDGRLKRVLIFLPLAVMLVALLIVL